MAKAMTIKEMTDRIDVEGGELRITRVQQATLDLGYELEIMLIEESGMLVGVTYIPLAKTMAEMERYWFARQMRLDINHKLEDVPYGVIQFIAERNFDFREYIWQDMKP